MMKLRIALVACVLATSGSAINAEPPIGSRVGERLDKSHVNDARDAAQAAHQLAGCLLTKRAAASRDLLAARSADEVKKMRARLAGEVECIADLPGNDFVEGVAVSYPPDIMRGDIAEELVRRSGSAVARLQPLPIQKVYSRSWFAFTGRDLSVDEMAACVADTNPAAVLRLIESQPFGDSEDSAFAGLGPYMGPCLRAGTKLEGKREPLRAALAEALYQRLANPAESAAAPTQTLAQAPQK